jgi:signal transduction histidine kinase
MPNRVSGEEGREQDRGDRDDHHRVCRLGTPPQGDPNATNLTAAVNRLVADNRARGGPAIEFLDDLATGDLRPELQTAIFSIVQELLLNACRHSKSQNVLLGLGQDNECVCVQVQDWGIGFDPEDIPPHKLGLQRGLEGVQQLVGRLGGTVDIESQPRTGTCVLVEIPLLEKTEPNQPAPGRRPK